MVWRVRLQWPWSHVPRVHAWQAVAMAVHMSSPGSSAAPGASYIAHGHALHVDGCFWCAMQHTACCQPAPPAPQVHTGYLRACAAAASISPATVSATACQHKRCAEYTPTRQCRSPCVRPCPLQEASDLGTLRARQKEYDSNVLKLERALEIRVSGGKGYGGMLLCLLLLCMLLCLLVAVCSLRRLIDGPLQGQGRPPSAGNNDVSDSYDAQATMLSCYCHVPCSCCRPAAPCRTARWPPSRRWLRGRLPSLRSRSRSCRRWCCEGLAQVQ